METGMEGLNQPDSGTSFVTGLANSLNSYLGQNIKQQRDMAVEEQKSNLELYRQSALETYKQTLAGKIDPNTASNIHPEAAKLVSNFQKQNNRYPTVEEFDSLSKGIGGDEAKDEKTQDSLEKQYADRLQKIVSFKSGGLGMTDQKVDQARQLRTLLNQTYDPKTDSYTLAPAQHSEIALGLAKLMSSTGQVPFQLEQELRQKTGREALASAGIYLGMDPKAVGGPTQSVIKLFRDSIDRQGLEAETQRDQYMKGLKDLVPTRLDPERADRLRKASLTSSYSDMLSQSPDRQHQFKSHPLGKVSVISPDGKRGFIPAGQLDSALSAGYKQAQ